MTQVTEPDLHSRARMPVRDFIDTAGVPWRVWDTRPSTRAALTRGFEHGWLTFESAAVRRRLAPVPDDWHHLSDAQLEQLCRSADLAPRRTRTPHGFPAPPDLG